MDSKEIYAGKDIAELARALDERFDTTSVVSIELEDVTQEQLKEWGYPDAKLLPIPGKIINMKKKPNSETCMSEITEIYAHLTELRKRVLRIVIVVGIIAVFSNDIPS